MQQNVSFEKLKMVFPEYSEKINKDFSLEIKINLSETGLSFLKSLIQKFPEFKEEIFELNYQYESLSTSVEFCGLEICGLHNRGEISGDILDDYIKRWSTLANEAYKFNQDNKINIYSGEGPSYGYWLSFESFAAYDKIVDLFKKYLDAEPLDALLDLQRKRSEA